MLMWRVATTCATPGLDTTRACVTVVRMSVLLRAEITDLEWRELRKRAVDLEMPVQKMVAEALRVSSVTAPAFAAAAEQEQEA